MPFLTRIIHLFIAIVASLVVATTIGKVTNEPPVATLTFFAMLTFSYVFLQRKNKAYTEKNLDSMLLKQYKFKATKKIQTDDPKVQIMVDESNRQTCITLTEYQYAKPKSCMLDNFNCSQHIALENNRELLMLDDNSNHICIVNYLATNLPTTFVQHSAILSSEVYEGGVSITQSKRLSQIGGVIVGGVLLGGAGAIIGGLSGKKKTSDYTNDITLRLCINDTQNPIIDIQFLNQEATKDSALYKYRSEQARRWHTIFSILIKRADLESSQTEAQPSKFSGTITEEIRKLAELKEVGTITEQEFSALKAKLLN